MIDELAIGECCKMGHSQVNAHIFVTNRERLRLADFAGEDRVPVLSFALDRYCFDPAFDIPMQVEFDGSDLRETEVHLDYAFLICWTFLCFEFPASTIGVSKRVIPIASLKARIARLFPILHAPKEVIIGPFET